MGLIAFGKDILSGGEVICTTWRTERAISSFRSEPSGLVVIIVTPNQVCTERCFLYYMLPPRIYYQIHLVIHISPTRVLFLAEPCCFLTSFKPQMSWRVFVQPRGGELKSLIANFLVADYLGANDSRQIDDDKLPSIPYSVYLVEKKKF